MILLAAVIAGLVAGIINSVLTKRAFRPEKYKWVWLVAISFIIQFLFFGRMGNWWKIPDFIAAIVLCVSMALLLIFCALNYKKSGIVLLGLGLLLNLAVILLNNGLMPISPETVAQVYPDAPPGSWTIGERLGTGKDIVLPVSVTRWEIFSDRYVLPEWLHYKAAFSIGDIFIAAGAFWILLLMGGPIVIVQKGDYRYD